MKALVSLALLMMAMAYLGEIHSSLPARVNAQEGVVCRGPPKIGPVECKAAFKRYYYDEESETCKLFIYGGCGATKNNFNSMEECQKTCPPGRDVCQLPKKTGRCKITPRPPWQRTRYFFNVDSQECEKFIFGGCGGTQTTFLQSKSAKKDVNPMYVNCRRTLATVGPVILSTSSMSIAKNVRSLSMEAAEETQTTFLQSKTAKKDVNPSMYVNCRRRLAPVGPVILISSSMSIPKDARHLPMVAAMETQTTFTHCSTV